ncbi:hypothetical protein [Cesiribacter sp. SM1]|uniref:hypothetical protein n=1 Tax=Cesiribacter sp. SM1 TaxID=2861196 RepID=UPI001CD2C94B|nr:hypothetical protein [Cesiribacter sp. SM1]
MIDLILCGIAYVIMIYFMVMLMKQKINPFRKGGDDDGGISVSNLPDLDDLPPGISLPDGSLPKRRLKKEPEEIK